LWRALRELRVEVITEHRLTAIEPTHVRGRWAHGHSHDERAWEADAVVLVTERGSRDGIFRDLESNPNALAAAGISAVYRVGDCVAPRVPAEAIFDGHRLAREIDAEDPAVPLPYKRERVRARVPV
jgi:dimethylamine/trimethylamine dehydrogenase